MKHLLVCALVTLYASVATAQAVGDHCELTDETKLFLAKEGRKYSARLPKGAQVVLRSKHGARWRVKGVDGRMGFIKTKWLEKVCRWTKPVLRDTPPTKTKETLDSGSVLENLAALEVNKAVAERPTEQGRAVAQGQAAVVEKARTARVESQQRDCLEQVATAFRVAVYDLELVNLPVGVGKVVGDALLAEVRKIEGISAIGMDEIREMISHESSRQAMGCEADDACLAEIAGALGVDEIITGRLSEEADGRSLLIRRIDQGRAEVVNVVNQRLEIGNGEEFLLALGPAVESLYPGRKNRPGTTRGVPEKLLLRLNPPPIDAGLTWTTAALATASLATGGIFAYLGMDRYQYYERGAGQEGDRAPASAFSDVEDTGSQYLMIGNAGLIGGAMLAITSLGMSFFTDWDGAGDDDVDEN